MGLCVRGFVFEYLKVYGSVDLGVCLGLVCLRVYEICVAVFVLV